MLMTKRLWKVKDKRDHPRLDRQWECFQVSREKVASDYLKKKKKMSLDSLQISRGAIWLYMHHTSFKRTQLRDKRKRFLNLWFLPQDEYIYVSELAFTSIQDAAKGDNFS